MIFVFLLSLVSIFFAIMTVTSNNPVVSVLFLIGLFISIAIYLMMLGLYFLGISYLLVYVGAISILFLFILMLINVRVSELLTEGINSAGLGLIAIVTLSFNLANVLPYYLHISDAFSNYLIYIKRYILSFLINTTEGYMNKLSLLKTAIIETGNVNSKSWDGFIAETNHISSIGNILYSNLFILLIIISLVLLLAMVGTIVITLKRDSDLKQMNLKSSISFYSILACIISFVSNISDLIMSNIFHLILIYDPYILYSHKPESGLLSFLDWLLSFFN